MAWPACARYEITAAPQGLGLVQDLLNTSSAGKPRKADLLDDTCIAQAWVDEALAWWARQTGQTTARIRLTADDLEELRGLRSELHSLVASPRSDTSAGTGESVQVPSMPVATGALRMHTHGRVALEPRGQGWRYMASAVLIEVLHAQMGNTWHRLKVCRNSRCGVAFYDRSRNNSAVWHSAKLCGNAENLRSYRARRRSGVV